MSMRSALPNHYLCRLLVLVGLVGQRCSVKVRLRALLFIAVCCSGSIVFRGFGVVLYRLTLVFVSVAWNHDAFCKCLMTSKWKNLVLDMFLAAAER